jgi:hypothetical protein
MRLLDVLVVLWYYMNLYSRRNWFYENAMVVFEFCPKFLETDVTTCLERYLVRFIVIATS